MYAYVFRIYEWVQWPYSVNLLYENNEPFFFLAKYETTLRMTKKNYAEIL